mmetsp:Transcript_3470/g.7875  ORF Transcript_3470/g.7875 Transcript_3470/m.7875 type:complete len:235 (+) Transcript_3470:2645-3349(+)
MHHTYQRHAHDVTVERNALGGILHTLHGLAEVEGLVVDARLAPLDNLNPVALWREGKGEAFHPPLIGFLAKLNTVGEKLLCRLVHIVAVEGYVAEPSVWLLIAVIDGECVVLLAAVVVGELERGVLHVPQIPLRLGRAGGRQHGNLAVLGPLQEVQTEAVLVEVILVHRLHPKVILEEWHRLCWIFDAQHGLLPVEVVLTTHSIVRRQWFEVGHGDASRYEPRPSDACQTKRQR